MKPGQSDPAWVILQTPPQHGERWTRTARPYVGHSAGSPPHTPTWGGGGIDGRARAPTRDVLTLEAQRPRPLSPKLPGQACSPPGSSCCSVSRVHSRKLQSFSCLSRKGACKTISGFWLKRELVRKMMIRDPLFLSLPSSTHPSSRQPCCQHSSACDIGVGDKQPLSGNFPSGSPAPSPTSSSSPAC